MEILELLARNESAIELLYREYARYFPQHRAFWSKMADEENQHAEWIGELNTELYQNKVQGKEPTSYSNEAIVNFGKYLEKERNRLMNEDYSPQEAFEVGYFIENTLIERRYLEAINQASPKTVKNVVTRLEEATKSHLLRIKQIKDSLSTKI